MPRNPQRDRPTLGDTEPLAKVTEEWKILARCEKCSHERTIAVPQARRLAGEGATAGKFRERLRCSNCGRQRPTLIPLYVGKRRD